MFLLAGPKFMALLPLMISKVPAPLMCFNSSADSVILVPFLPPIPLPIFQFSLSELLPFSPKKGHFQSHRQG